MYVYVYECDTVCVVRGVLLCHSLPSSFETGPLSDLEVTVYSRVGTQQATVLLSLRPSAPRFWCIWLGLAFWCVCRDLNLGPYTYKEWNALLIPEPFPSPQTGCQMAEYPRDHQQVQDYDEV